jgi:hypothetical protein
MYKKTINEELTTPEQIIPKPDLKKISKIADEMEKSMGVFNDDEDAFVKAICKCKTYSELYALDNEIERRKNGAGGGFLEAAINAAITDGFAFFGNSDAKERIKINSKKNKKSMKTRKLAINKIKVKQEEMDEIKSCKIDSKYYCPKCPRSAAKYQNLLSHLSLVHFKEILKPQLKPDLTCSICQKSFSVEHHAIYHLASSHNALLNHIPVKELLQIKTY